MFESLSNSLSKVFAKFSSKGLINEDDFGSSMREVRIALLEADVALPVVKSFIENVKEKALGKEVLKSITPTQLIIKIVHDELTSLLSGEEYSFKCNSNQPATILMVGLQGSGKTTSSAKLAYRLKQQFKKKTLLASLDTSRPAAQEQLEILAIKSELHSLAIIKGQSAIEITKRAMQEALLGGYDAVILDTAGRLHIDHGLMDELQEIKTISKPDEVLLTVDAMTGQDAVNIAKEFHKKLQITGIILSRIDGDSRGGAALSMKYVTGQPIKFIANGEKISDFEPFYAERIASRILDMGDVVSLVERTMENIEQDEAEEFSKRMMKGSFDMNDLASQIKMINKMGGVMSLLGMIPGMKKIKDIVSSQGVDHEKEIAKQLAIISSMTKQERKFPKLLNASRKKRVARGSGVQVQDVNKLFGNFLEMSKMIGQFSKMDKKSLLKSGILNKFGG